MAQPWWEDHMPDQEYINKLILQQQMQQLNPNAGNQSPTGLPYDWPDPNAQRPPYMPIQLDGGSNPPYAPVDQINATGTRGLWPDFWSFNMGPGVGQPVPGGMISDDLAQKTRQGALLAEGKPGGIYNPPPPVQPQIQGGHNFEPNPQGMGTPAAVPGGAGAPAGAGGNSAWALSPGGTLPASPQFPQVMPETNGAVPSVGESLSMPRPPASAVAGPPRTPEEEQKRLLAWETFYKKAEMNPNIWLALIKFGTEMMQPTMPNQTHLGHFGRALQGSLDFYTTANQSDREQAQKAEAHANNQEYRKAQTEQMKASTTSTEAKTRQTDIETEDMLNLRGLKKEELMAKVKQMQKSLDLTDEQIKNYQTELQRNPKYQEAMVRELNAKAKYYEQGGGSRGAAGGMGATFNNTQALADALLQTEPDLIEMARNNPQAARAAAWVRATERSKAVGIQQNYNVNSARQQYQYYLDEYNSLKAAGKIKGNKTFQQWAMDEIEFGNMDMKLKTELRNLLVRPPSQGPAPQGQTPSGSGGQPQAPKKTFGYDSNGNLIAK